MFTKQTLLIVFVFQFLFRLAESVRGCTVIAVQPDLRWKKAVCDSDTSTLTELPLDLPIQLIDLRITQQKIRTLTGLVLNKLVHLISLHLESSGLEHVDRNAFKNLSKLKTLSLKNNSLSFVKGSLLSTSFLYLPSLKVLDLSENPLTSIPANYFPSLLSKSLIELRISKTKGQTSLKIQASSFLNLENLRILDLSFNRLQTLPVKFLSVFVKMENLNELQLGGNPWNCDCSLRWLREWFLSDAVPFLKVSYIQKTFQDTPVLITPVCNEPKAVYGRKLLDISEKDVIEPQDFLCRNWINSNNTFVTGIQSENVSLLCFGFKESFGNIVWFKNKTEINAFTQRIAISTVGTPQFISTLNITGLELFDSGLWECGINDTYRMNKVKINLTVLNAIPIIGHNNVYLNPFWQKIVYVGIGVAVFFILVAIIAVTIFCSWNRHKARKYKTTRSYPKKFRKGTSYQYGIRNIGQNTRELIGNRAANSRSDSPGPVLAIPQGTTVNPITDQTNGDIIKKVTSSNITYNSEEYNFQRIPNSLECLHKKNSSEISAINNSIYTGEQNLPGAIEMPAVYVNSVVNKNLNKIQMIPLSFQKSFPLTLPANYLPTNTSLGEQDLSDICNNKLDCEAHSCALTTSKIFSPNVCPLHGSTAKLVDFGNLNISKPCPIHGSPNNATSIGGIYDSSKNLNASHFTQNLFSENDKLVSERNSKSALSLCSSKKQNDSDLQKNAIALLTPNIGARKESLGSYSSHLNGIRNYSLKKDNHYQFSYKTLPTKLNSRSTAACPIHGQLFPLLIKKRSASMIFNRNNYLSGSDSTSLARSTNAETKLSNCNSSTSTDSVSEVDAELDEYSTDTYESQPHSSSDTISSTYGISAVSFPQDQQQNVHKYSSRTSLLPRISMTSDSSEKWPSKLGRYAHNNNNNSSDSFSRDEILRVYSKHCNPINKSNCKKFSNSIFASSAVIGHPVVLAFGEKKKVCGSLKKQAVQNFSRSSRSLTDGTQELVLHHRYKNAQEHSRLSDCGRYSNSSSRLIAPKSILIKSKYKNNKVTKENP